VTPPLWKHQREGLAFVLPKPAAMVAAGMGTGKTALAAHAISEWGCRRILVVCPPSVRGVWRRMLPMHCPTEIRPIILDRGTVAMRTAEADVALRDPSPAAVVVNTEAVWREPLARWILARLWDAVVLDESHLGGVKTNGSNASAFVSRLTRISGHRNCLTGTPLAHSPLDAWGQYRFLDPQIFGPSYSDYLRLFAAPRQTRLRKRLRSAHDAMSEAIAEAWGHDSPLLDDWGEPPDHTLWLPGILHPDEFAQRIAPITWRCETADVLDLPPLIYDERTVDIGPEARRLYDALERDFAAEVADGHVTINSVLTLAVRLQQITSGFVPDDSGRLRRVDHAKRDALRDMLAEANEPTVVFCRFRADLDTVAAVAQSLGKRYAEISGRRKDGLTEMSTLRPGDVTGVQPKSGGAGIDLSGAPIGIWFSLAQSLPEYDQGVSRLHRPGTKGTRMYSIVSADTIDAEIHSAISDRREVVAGILARLRRLALTSHKTVGIIRGTSGSPAKVQGG